jgi:hypothetical protein
MYTVEMLIYTAQKIESDAVAVFESLVNGIFLDIRRSIQLYV